MREARLAAGERRADGLRADTSLERGKGHRGLDGDGLDRFPGPPRAERRSLAR